MNNGQYSQIQQVIIVKHLLSNLPHFHVLQDSDFDWIATNASCQTYQSGTQLIEEGKYIKTIYLTLSGNFATFVSQPSGGKEQLLALSSGDLIGETLLFDNRPLATTIAAVETSEVLLLPKQQLAQKLDCDRDFAARFYQLLSIKLSERLRNLTNLMVKKQIKEGEPLRKVLMVFATLNDSDIAWMLANGVAEKASLEKVLIQQGKSVPAIYLLLDGILGVYVSIHKDGITQEIEVAKRVKGDILGEMSFVDGGLASATVKSLESAWFLAIPQNKLAAKLKQDRGFASRFYRALSHILSNRCQDLFVQGVGAALNFEQSELLSADIEVEDEIDLDVLEGTAIAGTRFDWMIQQLHR